MFTYPGVLDACNRHVTLLLLPEPHSAFLLMDGPASWSGRNFGHNKRKFKNNNFKHSSVIPKIEVVPSILLKIGVVASIVWKSHVDMEPMYHLIFHLTIKQFFKNYFRFYVYKCFLCMHVCAPHAYII